MFSPLRWTRKRLIPGWLKGTQSITKSNGSGGNSQTHCQWQFADNSAAGLNQTKIWSLNDWEEIPSAVITLNSLTALSAKDLGEQARKLGVSGWRSMKKEDLVKALLKIARQKQRETAKLPPAKRISDRQANRVDRRKNSANVTPSAKPHSRAGKSVRSRDNANAVDSSANPSSFIAQKLRSDRQHQENQKNLALIHSLDREQKAPASDRLVLIVRDSYWLQAYWEITKASVERAKVALESQWHSAQPVLRLLEVHSDGNTNSIETLVEQFAIHGGVKNWFMHLKEPGRAYRVAIGYIVGDGRFYLICKSNLVCPPATNAHGKDENWTDLTNDVEKYFALSGGYDENIQSGDLQAVFEEKSRHPVHAPAFERLGSGINGHSSEFVFQVDAHMIVHGKTIPNGSVMIAGEPVRLQKDGSFSVRVEMPDRRQVLPIIASSRDGTQQRTTVLAIERNTKVMEPLINDCDD